MPSFVWCDVAVPSLSRLGQRTREGIVHMRIMGIAAIATAAVLGSTAMTLTTHATKAHGGSASSHSSGGNGGRASAGGGTGGDSTGGNGIGCGLLSGLLSNDLNNILGGQNQILNGANLLDNLFIPVLSPGGKPHQNTRSGGSDRKRVVYGTGGAGSGRASSEGGNGGRASSSGGSGGDSTGGNGILCGVLSGDLSNDLNNVLGGQTQILNGVGLLDNLFVPVLSPGGKPHQNTRSGG